MDACAPRTAVWHDSREGEPERHPCAPLFFLGRTVTDSGRRSKEAVHPCVAHTEKGNSMKASTTTPARLALVVCLLTSARAWAFDHSHGDWSKILESHVKVTDGGRTTRVDYQALKRAPQLLSAYTAALSKVSASEFAAFSVAERKAFLINAYNAFIVKLVVEKSPVKSIKDIGLPFIGPWKSRFIPLFGKSLSPDDLEHGMLRKDFADPRIHVAVNCASVSCPALRADAFVASRLEEQLEAQAQMFYSNPREIAFDPISRVLKLNSILKWFKEDFVSPGDATPVTYVSKYVPTLREALASGRLRVSDVKVQFSDYDWGLNETN